MFTIGHIIRNLRKQQKISQATLCDGICSTSYLSKIESGDANVRDRIINALLQRLGQDASRYMTYRTEKELEFQNKLYALRQHYTLNATTLHKELLTELLLQYDTYDCSIQQFLKLHIYIDLCRDDNYSPQKMYSFLMEALHLTKRKINLSDLNHQLFTQEEIQLLINIASMLKESGDSETPILILKQLRIYLENSRINHEFLRRSYPLVLINLTSWLGLSGQFYEAIDLCDKAISYCISYNDLFMLAKATYNKGYCLEKLELYDLAKPLILRAYHVAMATNNSSSSEYYKNHLLKYYQYSV